MHSCTNYLVAVVQQQGDYDTDTIRTIDSYFEMRRDNVGVRPCYALQEYDLNLGDEVIYNPVITELSDYIIDMIILDNVRRYLLLSRTS